MILGKLFSLPSQKNFPVSFKPKVAIAKFIGKMQIKVWYYEKLFGRHASFAPRRSVKPSGRFSQTFVAFSENLNVLGYNLHSC